MTSNEFKHALINPKNIYVLVSNDSALIDLYVKRFKEAIKADLISRGVIKPTGKLFKKKTLNVIYIPKIEEDLFNRKEYIFVYTDSIDKRSSAYKKHSNQIIEVNNDYTKFIMKYGFSEEDAKEFAKIHNNDLGLIQNDLNIYKESDNSYNRFTDYSSDIYGWVDNFILGKPLPQCQESEISMMALLSTNCGNLLKVKQNNTIGMTPQLVYAVSSKFKDSDLTEQNLIQIINDCFYLDSQVKKGLIDVKDTIKYLIVRRYNNGFTD